MNNSFNSTTLIGNIVLDPQVAKTSTDKSYCCFRVAVGRKHLTRDGKPITDFFNCICWGNTAEAVATYAKKGSMVLVQGELQTSNYTDKRGISHFSVEVVANDVRFLSTPPKASEQLAESEFDSEPIPPDDVFYGEPPF